jgi:hypothetical protein
MNQEKEAVIETILMEKRSWVSLDVKIAVCISEGWNFKGEVPRTFRTCFFSGCGQLAAYIICAVNRDPELQQERRFSETAAEALAQALRAEFNTNVELAVCELHLEGDRLQ